MGQTPYILYSQIISLALQKGCPFLLPSFFAHCPHLGAGTGPQSSCASTSVLDFNAAGKDPKALRHFLIANLPAKQVWGNSATQKSETLSTCSLCISPGLHSPGRFVEGNCANVEFLDLIDGANGEGAVIGQCQTGKKACSLE